MPFVATSPSPEAESLAERRARLAAGHALANEAARDNCPASIEELVGRAGDLAALPQVVMQVINLTGGAHTHANDIERVVGTDQALTARILTLANSSYYGLPRRISSIREAVVFLGFKTVRNLAMTVTSFSLFLGKSDADSLARRDLWKHSLSAGLCGKLIASAVPTVGISEEVFTAALLHDIGKMLMVQHMAGPFARAMAAARERHIPFHHVEEEFLPFTHAAVGSALATRWNLPPVLVEAIEHHHTPEQAAADPKTCAAVCLASDLANAFDNPAIAPAAGGAGNAPSVLNEMAIAILEMKADALHRLSAACADELRAGSALTSLM
jgi:putative nucleotidyltransferase with HDIG domain